MLSAQGVKYLFFLMDHLLRAIPDTKHTAQHAFSVVSFTDTALQLM